MLVIEESVKKILLVVIVWKYILYSFQNISATKCPFYEILLNPHAYH